MRVTRARRWARPGEAAAFLVCAFLLATVMLSTIAPGYTVTSQGPLDASRFASLAPDPSAAAGALSTLEPSVSTYERVWRADGGRNEMQDVLVRFPDEVRAESFLDAAQHGLGTGEIVSSDPLPSVPGGRRVTYFAATKRDGVGQAITTRAGAYADLLSLVSAAGNAHPIPPANAERLAGSQHAAMARAPGGATTSSPSAGHKKGASAGTIGLAVVVVAIAAVAVAAPGLLRRRRLALEAAATSQPRPHPHSPGSAGDAIDDLREHRG